MLGIDVSEGTAEGWFGRGKASAIVSVVVFALLIMSIIAVATLFAISVGGRANPTNYTEPDKYAIAGETAISSGLYSDAGLIKVTYKLDEIITGEASGLLIVRTLTLENKSARPIKQADLSLKIVDGEGKVLHRENAIPILNIGPGETGSSAGLVAFSAVNLAKLDNPKGFIITLENVIWETATPTPSATISPIEGSPGKVVLAFFEAMAQGRYTDVKKYLSSKNLTEYHAYLNKRFGKTYSTLEEALKAIPKSEYPQKVEVVRESISSDATEAEVKCNIYFSTGVKEQSSFSLIKEDGVWKLKTS